MKKLEIIGSKISELSKELWQLMKEVPPYYIERFNEISKVCELQNRIAALSNNHIADAIMGIIKQIAYSKTESNYETICMYSEEAIKDLASGMDEVDVLCKYDKILYDLKYGHKRGYRAKVLIIDDLCDVDKDIVKNELEKYL